MLTLGRLAHLGARGRPTRTRISEDAPSVRLPGPPSHVLRPRDEDLCASWPAHAYRCRQELPAQLAWAAPLLDGAHPIAVSCSHDQARQLIVSNNHLPTYQQTSFSWERLSRRGPPRAASHKPRRVSRGPSMGPHRTVPGTYTSERSTRVSPHLILLVEEDASTRAFLADQLAADGYEIVLAESRRHALHLLATHRPELVLADINGHTLGLLDAVRRGAGLAGEIDPHTPMIVLTARADELTRVRVFDRGGDDVVAKPFSYPELCADGSARCCAELTSRDQRSCPASAL